MSDFKLSKRSLERRDGVDKRLIAIDDLAIKLTRVDYGHPADAGVRTAQRQHELFVKGVSRADGSFRVSRHQLGLALDVYAYVDGAASWDEAHLTSVAAAFLQAASQLGIALEWGGLWLPRNRDMPHFQLTKK